MFFSIQQCSKERNIKISYEELILQELQESRDYLASSIVSFDISWVITPRDTLWYKDKIPEIFSKNLNLGKKVQKLYKSLSTGHSHVAELRVLLRQENQSEVEVGNLVCAIKDIIKYADEIGPELAQYIGRKWEIPPSDLSNSELINYYWTRSKKQDATAEQLTIVLNKKKYNPSLERDCKD